MLRRKACMDSALGATPSAPWYIPGTATSGSPTRRSVTETPCPGDVRKRATRRWTGNIRELPTLGTKGKNGLRSSGRTAAIASRVDSHRRTAKTAAPNPATAASRLMRHKLPRVSRSQQ